MQKPKPNLAAAVHGAARSKHNVQIVPSGEVAGDTKGVLLRLPIDLHRELRLLALDDGTSLQALGLEALQRMLSERRK